MASELRYTPKVDTKHNIKYLSTAVVIGNTRTFPGVYLTVDQVKTMVTKVTADIN